MKKEIKGNNKLSTDGIAEDLIRSISHLVALEMHEKKHIEMKLSDFSNAMVTEEANELLLSINESEQRLKTITNLRRRSMAVLMGKFEDTSNKLYWCHFKHAISVMITMFEVWQADDNETNFNLWHDTNKMFIDITSKFLGLEIEDCASCLHDIMNDISTEEGE